MLLEKHRKILDDEIISIENFDDNSNQSNQTNKGTLGVRIMNDGIVANGGDIEANNHHVNNHRNDPLPEQALNDLLENLLQRQ